MARRRKQDVEIVPVSEIPTDAIGAVVLADLSQIAADAETHPDIHARERILFAVSRLREIASGSIPPVIVATIPKIQELLKEQSPN
jgi:hypothetical protein